MNLSTMMTPVEFLLLMLVGGVCGAIGQAISGYSRRGFLVSITWGFVGALVGVWLAGQLGLPELLTMNFGGSPFPIIWSIIGSALFVAVAGLSGSGLDRSPVGRLVHPPLIR